VAGGGVGVRVVLGYGLLAGPARRGSPRAGPAGVAGATRGALAGWGDHMRWLSSRLACGSPRRRPVRVGSGPELKVSVLIEKRNFAEQPASSPVTTSGSVTKPVSGSGGMVRLRWKDPAPSAVQTQAPKMKVSPWLKATVGLK
jgi:hypothetical protein